MQYRVLTSLFSFLLFWLWIAVVSTCVLRDKSHVEDLLNAFNLIIDGKQYDRLHEVLIPDIIYYPGPGKEDAGQPVRGLPAFINTVKKRIPASINSYSQLGTKLIKVYPAMDVNRAEAVSYNLNVFFVGTGNNSTGNSLFSFVKYVDNDIIRTEEPGYGGWRIKSRSLELIVSYASRNITARRRRPFILLHRNLTQHLVDLSYL